jgi:hypothetical protein
MTELTKEEAFCLLYQHNSKEFIEDWGLDDMFSVCDNSGTGKSCPECGLIYEENKEDFYCEKHSRCKKCSRAYTRAYAKSHREKMKINARRYREKLRFAS